MTRLAIVPPAPLQASLPLSAVIQRSARPAEPPVGFAAPDHPGLRALLGALMCAGPSAAAAGWRLAEGCAQITRRVGMEPVSVRLHAGDAMAAWREVGAITPLALDVLTVLVDRFQAEGVEVRLVRCAEILEAKRCRRWGEERHALEAQIARELLRLGCFSVGDDDQPLFAVTPLDDGPTSFVVTLRAGLKDAWDVVPVRTVSSALLEFDHRTNRGADVLAKKLGLYLSLAGAGSRPVSRSVRRVLTGIGAHEALGARGGRFADRFEEATLRLQERGVFAVAYRGGDLPAAQARNKGWLKHWLDAELTAQPASRPSAQVVCFKSSAP